jgi:hypothetical protein
MSRQPASETIALPVQDDLGKKTSGQILNDRTIDEREENIHNLIDDVVLRARPKRFGARAKSYHMSA